MNSWMKKHLTQRLKYSMMFLMVLALGWTVALGAASRIIAEKNLEETRITISCSDHKAPEYRQIESPTGRQLLIVDCERGK